MREKLTKYLKDLSANQNIGRQYPVSYTHLDVYKRQGIQVARMAGMPPALLSRADEILASLEEKHADSSSTSSKVKSINPLPKFQLNIFDGLTDDLRRVQEILEAMDINTLTPVEALLKLNELKTIVKNYGK